MAIFYHRWCFKAREKLACIEKCFRRMQTHQWFVRFQQVSNRKSPLLDIMDEIIAVTVDSSRKVMIQ